MGNEFRDVTAREAAAPLRIGSVTLKNSVVLAPMSGVTDVAFRRVAHGLGAGLVVSEMVACEHLVQDRHRARRRTRGRELKPFCIQLAGYEARWMSEGARLAEDLGADIIDINMGCPAREVTGKQSGSALMRDLDHALSLVTATVSAVRIPVTLKMRLGWDDANRNAPELARRAEAAGIQLVTVHARTRCQFFKGAPDWPDVQRVKSVVGIPVVVNGDIVDVASARAALAASGADGVMVGRGAYGAPWQPGRIAVALATGKDPGAPARQTQKEIALGHIAEMIESGGFAGLKAARKHIGWYLATSGRPEGIVKSWRHRLCTEEAAERVLQGLAQFYEDGDDGEVSEQEAA